MFLNKYLEMELMKKFLLNMFIKTFLKKILLLRKMN